MDHTAVALGVDRASLLSNFPKFTSKDVQMIKRARGILNFKGKMFGEVDFSADLNVFGKLHQVQAAMSGLGSEDWFYGIENGREEFTFFRFDNKTTIFVTSDSKKTVYGLSVTGYSVNFITHNSSKDFLTLFSPEGLKESFRSLAGSVLHTNPSTKQTFVSLHFVVPPVPEHTPDKNISVITFLTPTLETMGCVCIDMGVQGLDNLSPKKQKFTAVAQTNKWERFDSKDKFFVPDCSPVGITSGRVIGHTPNSCRRASDHWVLAPRIALPDPMYADSM